MNDVSKSVVAMVHTYNEWAGEIRAAYTFDAGPNAVLYTLEKYQVELLALVLRYYPEIGNEYVNNVDLKNDALKFDLDSSLIDDVEKRCRVRDAGDVKMVHRLWMKAALCLSLCRYNEGISVVNVQLCYRCELMNYQPNQFNRHISSNY
jgi:hypothetical protein